MKVDDPAAVLADLARVKVLFQLRAISAVMGLPARPAPDRPEGKS